jgi:site-specific recombinase XerD
MFNEWTEFLLANYSKPPIRAPKTHEANENALKTLRPMFGASKIVDIDPAQIEVHLRTRLQQKRHVRRKSGSYELGTLKTTSVHQEFRVLRRIFSVAVKRKLVPTNPCAAVEFPVIGEMKGLFRPHCMTWSEQAQIEKHAPAYLRKVILMVGGHRLELWTSCL